MKLGMEGPLSLIVM